MVENPKENENVSIKEDINGLENQLEKRIENLEQKVKEVESFQNTICCCLVILIIAFIFVVWIWPWIYNLINYF